MTSRKHRNAEPARCGVCGCLVFYNALAHDIAIMKRNVVILACRMPRAATSESSATPEGRKDQ
jgi:hypothetical protein